MKKLLVGAMISALVLSMAACGGKNEASSEDVISSMAEPISSETSSEAEVDSTATDDGDVTYLEAPVFNWAGTYTEPIAGRCMIDIVPVEGDNYTVTVRWSSSAFESSNWEINATYYESTTLLEYTDAKYYVRTYTDENTYTDDVKYENGAGEFWFEGDMLGWRSANSDVDGIDGETFFERVE